MRSRPAKLLLALGIFFGVLVYVVIVELGVNAGRIHYGVSVAGVDVGGMTTEEAEEFLDERGRLLRDEPVIFTAEGFDCSFAPAELGWKPRPVRTTTVARRVGFEDVPFGAVSQRVRAWFGGVDIEWAGRPQSEDVGGFLDRCERRAASVGAELRRPEMRRRIRAAIQTWPRRPFSVPVRGGA